MAKFLDLRRKIAALLGYDTWADYITEVKMVKDARSVIEFLDDLEKKLRPVAVKERDILLKMKEKEHKELGLPFDGEFYLWDYRYYDRKYIEESLDLDDMLVKEYFPVSVVVPAILSIYQTLLGVKFVEIKGETWHPGMFIYVEGNSAWADKAITADVQHFSVWENDAKDESGFIGYCYLDLFPRGILSSRVTSNTGSHTHPLQNPNTRTQQFGRCTMASRRRTANAAIRSRRWWPISPSRHPASLH